MNRNEFDLLYEIKNNGISTVRDLSSKLNLSIGFISQCLNDFRDKKWIVENNISKDGLKVLEPYKVENAIIMAAGMSSRFVPLSLEKPKGLLTVKGEVLIERQIEQLHQVGINNIILVLGYKKESFFYLEDKYNIKIIINSEYNTKNNPQTLYLAQEYIGNSYICSSDNYFSENVFTDYVYSSYYSSIHVNEPTNEWYMVPDSKGNVSKVNKVGADGYVMLGHVYWDREFSKAFIELLNQYHETGEYYDCLWEELFKDNCKKLPPMYIKEYDKETIFEFDSLDELRKFDETYVKHSHSKILDNISKVLNCDENDVLNFKPIKEGLTNTSFIFEVNGKKYVYRHPGDGTEEIISRKHEKEALLLAKEYDIDPTFIYMDDNEGWKISSYVENIRIPDYNSFEDSKRVLSVLRSLHDKKLSVDWGFVPWPEACKIENLIREKGNIEVSDFEELKNNVKKCYDKTIGDGVESRFCHCDTYAPNWMLSDNETILIDWEYAGNTDPGCDIGTYIMDSMWEIEDADKFIKEYLQDDYNETLRFHYLAYTALISYYWFVWALYRESCGAVMGDSLHNWYVMAKRYSKYLCSNL